MKALIVEDSRLAREDLKALLQTYPEIQIAGEASHPGEASALLATLAPDVIFLDIHMPGATGFEFLDNLSCDPAIIFVTAYSEYAIQSFEYNTVDYLVKPVHPRSLQRAVTKVQQYLDGARQQYAQPPEVYAPTRNSQLELDSRVFLRDGERCQLVRLREISYFSVEGNHTNVHFGENTCQIAKPLNAIEERLPVETFFRANRQQIVNIQFVKEVIPWINGGYLLCLHNGQELTVSRRLAARFNGAFGL